MKPTFKKEIWLWLIMAIPVVYLLSVWNSLPETVPVHWNLSGEIDGWGSRHTLWLLILLVVVFPYVLMLIIPYVDPRGKIQQMGTKYFQLRIILTLFMCALATVIIYMTGQKSERPSIDWTIALCGLLFAGLGNFFQTIRPNYFMGIRTPWALESETVWKKTHRLAGRLWMAGGVLLVLAALLIPTSAIQNIFFITVLVILCVIPAAYSFILWRREQKSKT